MCCCTAQLSNCRLLVTTVTGAMTVYCSAVLANKCRCHLRCPGWSGCLSADSSVVYLKPYYDAMGGWDPPSSIEEDRKAGRKPKARLPFVWVMIYRHLSGNGNHPRPFDHGLVDNLNMFLFAKKPYIHKVVIRPMELDRRHDHLSETVWSIMHRSGQHDALHAL